MKIKNLLFIVLFVLPMVAYGDRYGIYENYDGYSGGGSGGGIFGFLSFVFVFLLLMWGWMFFEDSPIFLYIPTAIGFIPTLLVYSIIKWDWPWEFNLAQYVGTIFAGYFVGWLIIFKMPTEKPNEET